MSARGRPDGRATVFPEAIGLAATWDTSLMFRVSTAISDEGRAKYNEALRRGKHNIYQGITFWTPNINIFRDPRWGRGMETYGEDPYLTGRMAVAFIKGLQGDDPKYLKTIATAKHYAVHSGPESERHTFDVKVDERDLRETYLPQFEAAVKEGGARSVMCAYNAVDGLPACASPMLLQDILREKWGFNGYVVSDCGAVGDIYLNHKLVPTAPEGVATAIKAGTDLNCGVEYENLLPAVRQGLIAESEIDRAVRRSACAHAFNSACSIRPPVVKYAQIPYRVNDSPEHRRLALRNGAQSHRALEERQSNSAAEQEPEDCGRDRPECRRHRCSARQLQRHSDSSDYAACRHSSEAGAKSSALRARKRSRRQHADLHRDSVGVPIYFQQRGP